MIFHETNLDFSRNTHEPPSNYQRHRRAVLWSLLFCVTVSLVLLPLSSAFSIAWPNRLPTYFSDILSSYYRQNEKLCPQESPLTPAGANANINSVVEHVYSSDAFKNKAIDWLSGAVKIPTESFNDLEPVGQDPRWEVFYDFREYLKTAYPQTHSSLNVTAVNTHALVYHWQGSDPSLLPILLAAHQDVVPVDPSTADRWTHPPYSGYYDGEWLWGRGSKDDKSGLIGILSAVETLLEKGFQPKRTIVAAFGIDEESGGDEGAGKIGEYLEATYGKDGFALLVDEGGNTEEQDGVLIAQPNVAEKGSLNVQVQISTAGGHSSIPPAHTSIGLLSQAIVLLESNPHPPQLLRSSPVYSILLCSAEYVPSFGTSLRNLIKASLTSDAALRAVQEIVTDEKTAPVPRLAPKTKALIRTTQAVDIVEGGVKVNALPERASATINHRIAIESSVEELENHFTDLFTPFAKANRLEFVSFGKNITTSVGASAGRIEIFNAFDDSLEPAPITPTDTAAFRLLSGTILATHETSNSRGSFEEGGNSNERRRRKEMIVAPGLVPGNTDTQYYWSLTRNIFRFGYLSNLAFQNIHAIDERVRVDDFIDLIRFFSLLILNVDEAKDL